ncbi:MAG: carboxypeptidase-like regulatory domain-containing protein, partial [Bacteroidota bacterium]
MTFTGRNIVFLFLLLLVHQAYSQHNVLDKKIDIRFEGQSVREALKKLMKEGDCFITYQPSALPQGRQVTRSFRNTSISTIIQEVWGAKLKLRSRGNEITIRSNLRESEVAKKGSFVGRITDEMGEPLPGVTLRFLGTPYGAVTGIDGSYTLKNIPVGSYSLEVSSVGFEKIAKEVTIPAGYLKTNFMLKASTNELEEIVVFGKTEAETISEKAITISSLDVKKFRDQAIGTEEVLKTTTGLVVRQSGGLGSRVGINLNGLTGNAVRIYYDGIPLEVYGNGLPVNTIP